MHAVGATRSLYAHLIAVALLLEFTYFGMNCFLQWSAVFTIMALAILFMCIIICTIILGRALAQSPVLAYSYPQSASSRKMEGIRTTYYAASISSTPGYSSKASPAIPKWVWKTSTISSGRSAIPPCSGS